MSKRRYKTRRKNIPWFKTKGYGTIYLLQSREEPMLFKVGYTRRKTKTRRSELNTKVTGGLDEWPLFFLSDSTGYLAGVAISVLHARAAQKHNA